MSEIKAETRDLFSYILLGCPNFPAGTGSTTAKEFETLVGLIDAIVERTKNEDAAQWLRLCRQESQESWTYYERGDIQKGAETIQRAREYFDNAFSRKPIEARFIAREFGAPLDKDKGFPS